MSGSGSRMGAVARVQARSGAVILTATRPVTWPDATHQAVRAVGRSVRDEEAAGSNPATPTRRS